VYEGIIEELRKTYDLSADDRQRGTIATWKLVERHAFLELLIRENKTSLLEIGAGPGKDSKFFYDQGLQVISTDLSANMVQLCRAKGLESYQMDFLTLDFPEARFDAVYALNCLLHVPKRDLPAVLVNIHQLLRPSGLFFMGVYGGFASESIWEKDHHTPKRFFAFYSDDQIREVVTRTFDLYNFKIITPPGLSNPNMHFQRLILRKS